MYQTILDFWFQELSPEMWWKKSPGLDADIKERFAALHHQAVSGELFTLRSTAQGALAEVIIIDQFSRNIYRDHPLSFQFDALALALSQRAIEKNFNTTLSAVENSFLYLPFMHSESRVIHEEAVKLYTELGNELNLEFELKHKQIIDQFGRYPHRNKILGRSSTQAEIAFLEQPGSSF